LEVHTLKRLVFISLSLLLLLFLIPSCITIPAPSPNPIPPAGTPPVIIEFSNNPPTINAGGTSTLLWNVTGATSVSIDQGIGQVAVAGTKVTTVNSVSPPPPAPTSFAVTGIIANTEPSNSTGCFTLYANITANGAGIATYIWESTDGGGYSYTWNITFPTAGTQRITLPVEMSALPSGPYRVHVLTPNDIVSNSTYYTTCAP
jgi:hypothetical protein